MKDVFNINDTFDFIHSHSFIITKEEENRIKKNTNLKYK